MSGLSLKSPSIPSEKNSSYSANAFPYCAVSVPRRKSSGRKAFSLRKVYGTTSTSGLVGSRGRRRSFPTLTPVTAPPVQDVVGA